MPEQEQRQLDCKVGLVLRTGVLTSAGVIFLGGVLFLFRHGRETPDYRTFHGVAPELRSLHGIAVGAIAGHALPIIQFGLLLLIATPVARVVFSVFGFALEGDYLYTTIALIVLAVLLYSLLFH
ncbi:MAG: DUF1634 domain-containing protein [Acidobacteriaceae bacterium]